MSKRKSPIDMLQNAYNGIQLGAWGAILVYGITHIIRTGSYDILQENFIFNTLIWAQSLQAIDVIMAVLRITKTSPLVAFIQLFSRLLIVWVVFPANRKNEYAPLAVFPWCFAEIIRFSNYSNDYIGWNLHFLKILRHNAFLILYPIGVTGEFLSLTKNEHAAEKHVKHHFNYNIGDVETGPIIISFLKVYSYVLWPGLAFMYYTLYQARAKFYKGLTKSPQTEVEMAERTGGSPPKENSPGRGKKPKRE